MLRVPEQVQELLLGGLWRRFQYCPSIFLQSLDEESLVATTSDS